MIFKHVGQVVACLCSNPGRHECSTLKASLSGAGLPHAATYVSSAVINAPSFNKIMALSLVLLDAGLAANKIYCSPFPDGLQARWKPRG